MKKYITAMTGVIIVLIFTGGYWLNNKKQHSESFTIISSSCPGVGMFGFVIEKQNDGKIHFRIPSKPPQTDIVVTQTKLADGYVYKGENVLVADALNNFQATINGQVLRNCTKN